MSWLGGYNSKPSTSAQADLAEAREAKRKKLEAEKAQRAARRDQLRKQLLAAQEAQEEATQAINELLEIDPDIFNVEGEIQEVSEDILDDSDMADFDVENETDGKSALDKLGSVKCDFSKDDIEFWFTELESQLEIIEVKSQWTKRIALQRFLPAEIKQEVKSLLLVQKAQSGTDIYKRIKTELINLFGSKPEDSYIKAKNRVMTGKPSQLGKLLVDDICKDCKVKLAAGCCAKVVWGMFREALPVVIRNHIAEMTFTKDTYLQIFRKCDQIYDSNQTTQVKGSVAAVSHSTPTSTSDPEVAAIRGRGNRGGRGRGGGRGGRGGGSTTANAPPPPTTTTTTTTPKGNTGPKHATAKGDNDKLCKIHYKWGENGAYCAAPWKCPMKNIYKAPQ